MEIQTPQNSKNYKSFWPIVIIAVLSALVGGLLVWAAFNSSLDEQVSSLLPGSQHSQRVEAEKRAAQVQKDEIKNDSSSNSTNSTKSQTK